MPTELSGFSNGHRGHTEGGREWSEDNATASGAPQFRNCRRQMAHVQVFRTEHLHRETWRYASSPPSNAERPSPHDRGRPDASHPTLTATPLIPEEFEFPESSIGAWISPRLLPLASVPGFRNHKYFDSSHHIAVKIWNSKGGVSVFRRIEQPHINKLRARRTQLSRFSPHHMGNVCGLLRLRPQLSHCSHVGRL